VREETLSRGLSTSRANLVLVGNEMRAAKGPGALVGRLVPRLTPPAIVDSVRNPGEVEALRRIKGFYLLGVDAPPEVRLARIKTRGRLGDIRTAAEFEMYESRENSHDSRSQRISATLKMAGAIVINDASLEELHSRVIAVLDQWG
jgi:dephospho-CoA kinase